MESKHSKRILVVDDEESLSLMVLNFLRRAGYDCQSTTDPNNALAMLEEDNFGLVISDISMPEMNGMDLLREIRLKHSGVDTIMMTGYTEDYTYSDIIQAGAADYIGKPFQMAELKAKVERVERERSMLGEIQKSNATLEVALNRMHAITDSARDAILMMDSEGLITYWNPAAEHILGYTKEDVIGRNLHGLIVPERFHAAHHAAFPVFLETGQGAAMGKTLELVALRKDGEEIPVEISLSAVFMNGWQAVGLLRDITERKQAEEKIRQQYERLQNANSEIESLYQRLQREYELAAEVFSRVSRIDYSRFPNIRHTSFPISTVGGDLLLVAPKPSGGMCVLLGDFTGHGLSAALGAIPVADIFHTMSKKDCSIGEIIAEMNTKLKALLPTGLFFCACFLELNSTHDSLNVWNCGMPDALLVGALGEIKQRFPSTGLPLGIVDTEQLEKNVEVIHVSQGDTIYAHSDGLIEVCNAQGEAYGQERFERSFHPGDNHIAHFDQIMNDFLAFHGDCAPFDDVILAEIKCGALDEMAESRVHGFGPKSPAWKMSLELGPDNLRSDPLQVLMTMLMDVWELRRHKENIYLIFAELLSNAVDHGVLGLDPALRGTPEGFGKYFVLRQNALETLETGWVKVDVQFIPHRDESILSIRVEDSGPGFDHSKIDDCTLTGNLSCNGRGIQLVQSMCRSLEYNKKGNCVEAVFAW